MTGPSWRRGKLDASHAMMSVFESYYLFLVDLSKDVVAEMVAASCAGCRL